MPEVDYVEVPVDYKKADFDSVLKELYKYEPRLYLTQEILLSNLTDRGFIIECVIAKRGCTAGATNQRGNFIKTESRDKVFHASYLEDALVRLTLGTYLVWGK